MKKLLFLLSAVGFVFSVDDKEISGTEQQNPSRPLTPTRRLILDSDGKFLVAEDRVGHTSSSEPAAQEGQTDGAGIKMYPPADSDQ